MSRATLYCRSKGDSAENLAVMEIIDKPFLDTLWYGSHQMARHMKRQGHKCGRHRVRRLMRVMRLVAIYQNQVWCADTTYIRMERGFPYLVATMVRYSRKVLAWQLSNTLDADCCVAALKDALTTYGPPEIFNTDQGSQFTGSDWIDELKEAKVKISMDGKGHS
ncbi:integrase core domain protein [Roseovarius sp. A-2]|uniref:DDE-type integrase/transposase/recombinase n=1 Tax=Roseovarius sp. A-2 TaxID=1570360 RepID=UPI0009B586BA|nr:DDE-type integrase/transposase/recombinase [Roseovarius sp. A-2]GAW35836.1 integrase core domain protein [Roseovarius sp. A-2]